jgi:hypothetical protein
VSPSNNDLSAFGKTSNEFHPARISVRLRYDKVGPGSDAEELGGRRRVHFTTIEVGPSRRLRWQDCPRGRATDNGAQAQQTTWQEAGQAISAREMRGLIRLRYSNEMGRRTRKIVSVITSIMAAGRLKRHMDRHFRSAASDRGNLRAPRD